MLRKLLPARFQKGDSTSTFVPKKKLGPREKTIVDRLNGDNGVSFCITDPAKEDNPIIFISDGFCKLTGYARDDVVGKNCRFLQGAETKDEDTKRISEAIKAEMDFNVSLTNYRKDGTKFKNEFFLTTLKTSTQELAYNVGIQIESGSPSGVIDNALVSDGNKSAQTADSISLMIIRSK